ncbi:ribosome maturation factor RimP [Tepidibacter formicigenes]|jgi:ribosome maturation factor RimP|uniref:Ribosome maturation factor RimP n=1 Tax=Tepidibacter formicigenes DSM 15518 TaxID=1123349 RepID=A0A1M6JCG4_9FIRM|nr:ribosome maturation factor RimP [Tepidibacter formicigenes]SHJ44320.1 ribosome maturation factor RimP [Tepidibacter formicigenes DSM 15518]
MRKNIEKTVEDLVLPIVEKENFELIDIEYVQEAGHKYLRVYIDKDGGISLNDCKLVSEELSKKLDELDPIKENYFLEVSSPGLDRPLKKDKDFERYKGRDVELKLYKSLDGKKQFEGELLGLFDGIIKIKSDKEVFEFNKKDVSIIRLSVKI